MTQFDRRDAGQQGHADPFAMWDAAYVLGSLDAEDRRQYEAHLSTCARCREAVAELAGMPALLALLDPDKVLDEASPELPQPRPELLDSLLAKVSWRNRRRRRLTWGLSGAAAAAAAVVIAVLAGIHPGAPVPSAAPPATSASALTMTRVAPNSIEATISLIGEGSGTRIEMTCTYAKEPDNHDNDVDKLAMVVVARDGSHARLATWMAPPGVTVQPVGITPLRTDQIAAVQIVSDDGDVLLQRNV